MKPRTGITAFLLATAAFPALATDVSLFEGEGFRGRQLMLRMHTPDLAELGYRDPVASLVVRTGRWEFCSEPAFKGFCATFAQGAYPALSTRFNNRISSARPLRGP